MKDQSFIVEPNPNWPGNMRVDIRDERWQQLLLRQEVPRLLTMGFDGLMLDTLDTVPYLENKDPSRFAGSRRALADWLRALRRAAPRAVIVANGTESLIDAAPFVDGFIVEGVFAMYDFTRRIYRETTDDERAWKLGVVSRARSVGAAPGVLDRIRGHRRHPPGTLGRSGSGETRLSPLRERQGSQRVAMTPATPIFFDFGLHVSIYFEYLEKW